VNAGIDTSIQIKAHRFLDPQAGTRAGQPERSTMVGQLLREAAETTTSSSASSLLRDLARRTAVMRREAACGIAADSLLTETRAWAFSSWAPVEARLLELGAGEVRCLRWAPCVQADPSGG
jgi:hypothetical protein